MKLFLSSFGIQPNLGQEFLRLVGKPAKDIRFAYITNAADPYPPEKRGWMDDVMKMFTDLKLSPETIDLKDYHEGKTLKAKLSQYDVIWCGGGNTWYLRYVMKTSSFDQIIKDLVEDGKVYGGDSAGAIIMGPTLKYVDMIDEPEDSPERIEQGLGIVKFVIVPHWGTEKYLKELAAMRDGLANDGYDVKALTDKQAVVVNGSEVKVL